MPASRMQARAQYLYEQCARVFGTQFDEVYMYGSRHLVGLGLTAESVWL